jgi:hypothetical protein
MEQDWMQGLLGGLLIGLAGAVYLLGNGKIMGASGIIGGLVDRAKGGDTIARLVFLLFVAIAPAALIWAGIGGALY